MSTEREKYLAIREGHFDAASEAFFSARPQLDNVQNRRIFYAGHCYGYDAGIEERITEALTFDAFRKANVARCLKWHPKGIDSWSASDWMTALVGEVGELGSLLKMRNRERDGLPGNKFSPTKKQIADEIADVFAYLDLLAAMHDISIADASVEKFNEVSERVGFSDRIPSAIEPAKKDPA